MPQNPTMTVVSENRSDLAAPLTRGTNKDLTDLSVLDPNMIRKPDYFVYVFSAADRSFDVSRPGLNISRLKLGYNSEAIGDPDAYQLVWKVPSPYPLPYADQTSGEVRLNSVVGEKAAIDVCNPNNKDLQCRMDAYVAPESEGNIGLGDDLIAKGLFFVSDNPVLPADRRCTFAKDDKDKKFPIPPAVEVAKAVARKEKYYNGLLDKAKSLEYSNQRMLEDFVASEPDVHLACEYFDVETRFHQKRTQKKAKVECPMSGMEMTKGADFHPFPGSKIGVCVHDWDAAIAAGVVEESARPGKKSKPEVTA